MYLDASDGYLIIYIRTFVQGLQDELDTHLTESRYSHARMHMENPQVYHTAAVERLVALELRLQDLMSQEGGSSAPALQDEQVLHEASGNSHAAATASWHYFQRRTAQRYIDARSYKPSIKPTGMILASTIL